MSGPNVGSHSRKMRKHVAIYSNRGAPLGVEAVAEADAITNERKSYFINLRFAHAACPRQCAPWKTTPQASVPRIGTLTAVEQRHE